MEESTKLLSVTHSIPVAWGDMDAFAHVNNTVFLRWFESGRIAWWERVGQYARLQAQGIGPTLARAVIDYRRPVKFPDTVEVTVTTLRVGEKSTVVGYRVTSAAQGNAVVAEGETVLVFIHYGRNQSVPIDDELRRHLEHGSA